MLPTVGLRTHIWNNFIKSGLLLAGFPFLLLLVTFAVVLMFQDSGKGIGSDMAAAAETLPVAFPVALLVSGAWFGIAWLGYQPMINAITAARPVTREQEPRLWNLLENLCISRGMRMPRLAVIETAAMNAYASGLTRDKGAVTVTRGLMDNLDDRELQAVLAHELAHIRNGDARLGLIAAVFVGIISLGFDMMTRGRRAARVGRARGGNWRVNGNSRGGGLAALIGILVIAAAWLLSMVLRMALSRNREFLADAGAVELTADPDAMISALRKVEGNADMPEVSPQVRALFLEDSTDNALSSLMATHPPIGQRVATLVKMAGGRDPGRIERASAPAAETPAWAQQDASDATIQVAPNHAAGGAAPWWQGPAQGDGGSRSPWGPRH